MGCKDHSFSERWRNWEVDEIETGYPRSLQDSIGPLHVNYDREDLAGIGNSMKPGGQKRPLVKKLINLHTHKQLKSTR